MVRYLTLYVTFSDTKMYAYLMLIRALECCVEVRCERLDISGEIGIQCSGQRANSQEDIFSDRGLLGSCGEHLKKHGHDTIRNNRDA
jgi:hypothetical protein